MIVRNVRERKELAAGAGPGEWAWARGHANKYEVHCHLTGLLLRQTRHWRRIDVVVEP